MSMDPLNTSETVIALEGETAQSRILRGGVPELLRKIFEQGVLFIETDGLPGGVSQYAELWTYLAGLTEVCKAWKTVAIDDAPRLWRNIWKGDIGEIYDPVETQGRRKFFAPMLTCLQRSKSVALQLEGSGVVEILEMLDLISRLDNNDRVVKLTLRSHLEYDATSHFMPQMLEVPLPKLKCLVLGSNIPHLWEARLLDVHLVELLSHHRHIVSFVARKATWPSQNTAHQHSVVILPLLEEVYLETQTTGDLESFFLLISAPKLKDVTLLPHSRSRGHSRDSPPATFRFHDGTFDNVHRLTFGRYIWAQDLFHLLPQTPLLEELRMEPLGIPYGPTWEAWTWDEAIVNLLIRDENHPQGHVPDLKRFILTKPRERIRPAVSRLLEVRVREDSTSPVDIEVVGEWLTDVAWMMEIRDQ